MVSVESNFIDFNTAFVPVVAFSIKAISFGAQSNLKQNELNLHLPIWTIAQLELL